jgi:hypothetical protein
VHFANLSLPSWQSHRQGVRNDMARRRLACQDRPTSRKSMRAVLNSALPLRGDYLLKQVRHDDNATRAQRYKKLISKMAVHQQGAGLAPTAAEFEQWKEDAAFEFVMRRLQANLATAA